MAYELGSRGSYPTALSRRTYSDLSFHQSYVTGQMDGLLSFASAFGYDSNHSHSLPANIGCGHSRSSLYSFPGTSLARADEDSSYGRCSSMTLDGFSTADWNDSGIAFDTKPHPFPALQSQPIFHTDVDTLVRAIQSKPVASRSAPTSAPSTHFTASFHDRDLRDDEKTSSNSDISRSGKKREKKYRCELPGCEKTFFQKTHLDIHLRAHTGDKPYLCSEPFCGQRFSQHGNLKTHQRRHTGERPYNCEICGKKFAQRGNVRAHQIVHEQAKPYLCKLDECNKQFTQLGNLKSHQNKFHSESLRLLTQKFAMTRDGENVSRDEEEMRQYFAELYRNSNKGIKGRGKDRRIFLPSVYGDHDRGDGSLSPNSVSGGPSSYLERYSLNDNRMDLDSDNGDNQHTYRYDHDDGTSTSFAFADRHLF